MHLLKTPLGAWLLQVLGAVLPALQESGRVPVGRIVHSKSIENESYYTYSNPMMKKDNTTNLKGAYNSNFCPLPIFFIDLAYV